MEEMQRHCREQSLPWSRPHLTSKDGGNAEGLPGAIPAYARGISASDLQDVGNAKGLSGTILAVHVSRRLRSVAYTAALRRIVTIVRRGAAVASDAAAERVRAFVRNRRRHAYLRSLHSLNDHALKDIGLHRSEISSVVRELVDDVPPSRVRTASTRVSTTPCDAR